MVEESNISTRLKTCYSLQFASEVVIDIEA